MSPQPKAKPALQVERLALRRSEAAAALGISEETFDKHIRPHLAVVRVASVRLYPVAAIEQYLLREASAPIDDLAA